jgi:hypothetical protein
MSITVVLNWAAALKNVALLCLVLGWNVLQRPRRVLPNLEKIGCDAVVHVARILVAEMVTDSTAVFRNSASEVNGRDGIRLRS